MTESEISLEKLILSIKNIVDLTMLNPKNYDKFQMSSIIHIYENNTTIAFPHSTDYYKLDVIQYVRTKSKTWNSRLSDEYITNELKELVLELKINSEKYMNIGRNVKDWIQKLKTSSITNYRFIFPVNNVDYRKDIEFDRIKLKKLKLDVLRSFIPFQDALNPNDIFSTESQFEDLVKFNHTEIFAFIDVQAKDEDQGKILAESYLKKLIHAIKLFNPPSGICERVLYFPETKFSYLVVDMDTKNVSFPMKNLHLNAHVWPYIDYWKRIEPYWQQLSNFLFSDDLTEIQSLILTALYWYGEASKETEDQISKFLKYLYGLESLLIFDNQYGKSEKISQRLATIQSKENPEDFDFYYNLMFDYYKFRSQIVHSGKLIIDDEDVATTHTWLRHLIFDYILFSKKYDNVQELFQKEFSIKII